LSPVRRALGRCTALAMVLTVVACELAVDLGPYQQSCPGGQKACADMVTSKLKCVSTEVTDYGCSAHSCASCDSQPNNNVAQYGCMGPGSTCQYITCNPGWNNCDGNALVCSSNKNTDFANCGSCGNNCAKSPNIPNAGSHYQQTGCVGGSCKVTQCDPGFFDCDGAPTNGCEATLLPGTCCPSQGTCPPSGCVACPAGKTCDMTTMMARPMCK
jgi:hypothetical protein